MDKEYNELQIINNGILSQLNDEAKRQRESVVLWYEAELKNDNLATEYRTLDSFSAKEWNVNNTQSTVGGLLAGTQTGLGEVYIVADLSKTSQYYLNLQTSGTTLSESLRDSAREAEKLTKDAVNKHLKSKTTVKRLTGELTSKNVSKGKLPKYLEELAQEAKIAGGNTPRMRKLIKQAERNISELVERGATSNQLKKAYNGVLKQVARGDVEALNSALKVAIDQKAVYNNRRIAQTELSKSYSKGFARQLEDHPLGKNAFVKVSLSSAHSITDVCDFVTGADLHNRGAGVYPQDEAPNIPLHPFCLCQYTIAGVRDIDGRKTKYNKKNEESYMNNLSEKEQRQVQYSRQHTNIKKLLPLPKDQVFQTEMKI